MPAPSYHEACPLGNGRLGVMDFGGVSINRIVLNEAKEVKLKINATLNSHTTTA